MKGKLLTLLALLSGQDLDPASREAVEGIVSEARRASLPAEDLESKVREGLAKGVEPARIVAAVRARADSFRVWAAELESGARDAGRPLPESSVRSEAVLELRRAEDLGLGREPLRQLVREALRGGSGPRVDAGLLLAVIRFAGQARGTGMPEERVASVVRAGLERGYSAEDFVLMRRRLHEWRERYGPALEGIRLGNWLEEGIRRQANAAAMLQHVMNQVQARIPPSPPPVRTGPPSSPPVPHRPY